LWDGGNVASLRSDEYGGNFDSGIWFQLEDKPDFFADNEH
jgi:hypothetical protein